MTREFPPIAIVGRACLLPGASSPAELWRAVVSGQDLVTSVPAGRWGIAPADVLCDGPANSVDRTWSDRGGYVRGFDDRFDPDGFAVPAAELADLDPVFRWTLHTARQALRDAGRADDDPARFGAVFGNLSFPSAGMAAYTQAALLAAVPGGPTEPAAPDPRNRFSSGLPALLLERALGLGAGAFALDAACASSLYAVKIACDRLHDGVADLMLAGAVNCADDLCIHLGFTALQALSRSGRSRPFHRDADGLVPAEGCGFVALRRLADARRDGDEIHGIIRGVALSNDGRGRGMLVPSASGQARAMRGALAVAGLAATDVSLLECHATGTQAGDAVEVRSTSEAYVGNPDLPIGSLKSNVGHLIAVAGIAGLIKVVEAMRHEVRPPTINADVPVDVLADSPLRLLQAAEPWDRAATSDGVLRAGVSAFGFGGNNAHLIVEEPGAAESLARPDVPSGLRSEPVAVVGIGAAAAVGRAAFTTALRDGGSGLDGAGVGRRPPIELPLSGQRFPPNDLKAALAQQLSVLQAATEAVDSVGELPRETTGIYVGMGVDPGAARYGVRWRIATLAREWGCPPGWVDDARAGIGPALDAPAVLGTMPNIVANRLNSQFDLAGASFTVSSEERSGLDALDLAARALRAHEIDAAIVGAVDMSSDPVHRAAVAAVLPPDRQICGDAAVALVLKRLDDAERDGNQVVAILPGSPESSGEPDLRFGVGTETPGLTAQFGHAHAASGLLHVAAAALALHQRVAPGGVPLLPGGGRARAVPATTEVPSTVGPRTAAVEVEAMEGLGGRTVRLAEAARHPVSGRAAPPRLHVFSGETATDVLAALDAGRQSAAGPARLVLVADGAEQLAERADRARRHLRQGYPPGDGVHFRAQPLAGELAFVFTAAGAAYHQMGAELLRALPEIIDPIGREFPLRQVAGWVFDPASAPTPSDYLWGTAMLSQAHARLSLDLLGLAPSAAIGYSSGESNSLFAFGVWSDMDAMRREIEATGLMDRELGVEFRAVARAWGTDSAQWAMWNVLAPLAEVRNAIADEPRVHLAIVNTGEDVVIGGDADGCRRVVSTMGAARCRPLDYNLACHVPEVAAEFHQPWTDIHTRAVTPVPGLRHYSNGACGAYTVSPAACAEMITRQAETTLDFPATIEAAYTDGVRIFVEHGPGGACTQFVREILRDRDILAVQLDRRDRGVGQVFEVAAALTAAGVTVDHEALTRRLTPVAGGGASAPIGPVLSVPAHRDPVRLPSRPEPVAADGDSFSFQAMPPAPRIPPVVESFSVGGVSVEPRRPADPVEPARPAPPITVGAAPGHPAAARLRELMDQVTAIHGGFLSQQAALHTQFLATRVPAPARPSARPPAPANPPPHPGAPAAPGPAYPPAPVVAAPTVPAAPAPPPPSPPPPAPTPPPPAPPGFRPADRNDAASAGLVVFRPAGPVIDRRGLETHASGRISDVFGPLFRPQDAHALQCRMPEPPLLLADGVDGIEAEAGVLGRGAIWTHTDVRPGSWYLNGGYMPAGFMIESGQADLMLISYMGIDLLNQGRRSYRLLGCTLTYHGDLPAPGERLEYEIRINGHATYGDVRLFFFEYDCISAGRPRLTVRGGQAGFFNRQELDDAAGVLWTPAAGAAHLSPDDRVDPAVVTSAKSSFTRAELVAFSQGRVADCFGPGFEWTQTHTRTPKIQSGGQLFIERIPRFEPGGGPWGRGFMRCETTIVGDEWFFDGHFKNDPCMPGNFMVEACIQALSFYLAALGFTTRRDGWRFQPLPERPFELKCRGEVNPQTRSVAYELHVSELWDGPHPTIVGDVIGYVDGRMAFHAHRIGVELVPGWPLSTTPESYEGVVERGPVATDSAGFRFDWKAMLACAWGRPDEAFGSMFASFPVTRRPPRLPGPPYHFISRISRIDGALNDCRPGMEIVSEYDIPPDAWYFDTNGASVLPFAVLLEAALQPCGWVATAVGSTVDEPADLLFRNLDGTGTVTAELGRTAGTLRTRVRLTSVSRSGDTIIEGFEVACSIGDRPVFKMETLFGFFPPAAFENQVGLPVTDHHRGQLTIDGGPVVDLTARPARFCTGHPRLPEPMLLMIDRAVHIAGAGRAGLGLVRGEKGVDPAEWFFKAHFFQDPVQPGSLGVEALLQLLQFFLLDTGAGAGIADARFEAMMLERPMTWKYRGQVTPAHLRITTVMEITEIGTDDRGPFVIGAGSLWCDGLRIYEVSNMGMRIVSGTPRTPAPETVEMPRAEAATAVREHWGRSGPAGRWAGQDLIGGLIDRYVNRLLLARADVLDRLRGRSVIFLANHQVQIESVIIGSVLPALTGVPMTTMANAKHRRRWVGQLVDLLENAPGSSAESGIVYFDQARAESMIGIVDDVRARMAAGPHSLFVHVDGTRARSCREPATRCSSVLLDLAAELGVPIVPIRFTGGLPVEPLTGKADFPVGHGSQDYWIGEPIEAAGLSGRPLRDRVERVLSAINTLGPPPADEVPRPPDPDLADNVARWQQRTGVDEAFAVAWQVLDTVADPSEDTLILRVAAQTGGYRSDGTPRGDWLAAVAGRLFTPASTGLTPASTGRAGGPAPAGEPLRTITVGRSTHPHLADHAIAGRPVVPVAYAVEWFARAAIGSAPDRHGVELADIAMLQGVVLDGFADGANLRLEIVARTPAGAAGPTRRLELVDATGRGRYRCTATRPGERPPRIAAVDPRGGPPPRYGDVLFHGATFRMLESVVDVPGGLSAELHGVAELPWPAENWVTDPALTDGALQLALLWTQRLLGKASLPTGIARIRSFAGPAAGRCTATLVGRDSTAGRVICDVTVHDQAGAVVVELLGIETHALPG